MGEIFTRDLVVGDLVRWNLTASSLLYGEVVEVRKAGSVVVRMMCGGKPEPREPLEFQKRMRGGGYALGLRPIRADERAELHERYLPPAEAAP